MRVGLLEDDEAIQEMLQIVLQEEGHTVLAFTNAQTCLETIDASPTPLVDLMIVDFHLDGKITGKDFILSIRQNKHLASLPIIFTTATDVRKFEDLKHINVALLEKPFAVDDMTALIKNVSRPS